MSFSFSVNNKAKRKTPFQKQKELEEERKKRDDEEAAKVYEDFVKDFGGGDDDNKGPKGFVSGGVVEPGKREPGPPPAKRRHYVPSFMPPGMEAALENKDKKKEESVFQLPSNNKGKPRSIDLLLQDLKKEQAQREQRKEQGLPDPDDNSARGGAGVGGTFDNQEQGSTNLFLGNLAPDVDESTLMHEFGRFGPIGSVKVMWPRDEEQRRRGRNTGFVAFMRREDAEKAKDALDGVTLRDLQITIGFGKAVPLPAVPIWPPPEGLAAAKEVGAPVQAPDAAWQAGVRGRRNPDAPLAPPKRQQIVGIGPDVHVQIPDDDRQQFVIDAVAFYVLRDGCEFEQVVMERELNNPEFGFLFDVSSPEHAYYRWRLYSLACGDSLRSWRVEPFLMAHNSNRWFPPPMTLAAARGARTSAQQKGDRKEEVPFPDLQRDKFEHMLRTLTVERQDICNAMVFALDHADSASYVSEVLIDALTLPETPVPVKIARLFLLSDILHNTSAPIRNVSKYRAKLQDALPDIFQSLQETCRLVESRMALELLRKHVLKVLRTWRGWFIFSDDFLNGLQATFLCDSTGPGGAVNKPEFSSILEEQLKLLSDDELELKCRHSGLSRSGGREGQINRLLTLDAYMNGRNAQSRWTSTPGTISGPAASAPALAATLTPFEDQGKVEKTTPAGGGGDISSGSVLDDQQRHKLRQVEVSVLEYREELEQQGLAQTDVDMRVEERRKALLDALN